MNISRLEALLRECPSVRIVISSSWQEAPSREKLRAHFSPDIRARIVGATLSADPDNEAGTRYDQIKMYLRSVWPQGARWWISLDDEHEEFPFPCAELVPCRSAIGFDAHAERALRHALRGHVALPLNRSQRPVSPLILAQMPALIQRR